MKKPQRKILNLVLAVNMAWTSCAMAQTTPPPLPPPLPGAGAGHSEVNAPGRETLPEFNDANRANRPDVQIEQNYEPIKSNRALVPVGNAKPPGQSEINSPGIDDFRPSKIREALEKHNIKYSDSKELVPYKGNTGSGRELVPYSADQLNEQIKRSANIHEALKGLKGPAVAASAFYVALGFVAAYSLIMSGETNPVAWDAWYQAMPWNDPVGALALLGFMAGAALFYKKMNLVGANGGGMMRQLPLFAGALFVGALISTAVSVMAKNDQVKLCINSKLTDCDGAWNWAWASAENEGMISEIAEGYMPLAANILVGGSIYLGAVQTASFIYNRYKIGEAIQVLSRGKINIKSVRPGLVGFTAMAVHGGMFLISGKISNALFATEKWIRQFLITKAGFTNTYGHSLEAAETNLYTEWIKAKKEGFKAEPLVGIIKRHSKLNNAFRATELEETLGAFKQWMTKQTDFVNMIGASYEFYKTNLPLIREGKFTPDILTKPLPTPNRDLESENMANTWKYVFTPRIQHYLLTSMACGAEAEGYHSGGLWQGTREFVANWWSGNTSPDKLIDNSLGSKVAFAPPRITNRLPGENDTICEKNPTSLNARIQLDPDKFPINLDGKSYIGLHEYIKDNLRDSVANDFDGWWQSNVMTAAIETQKELRKEYEVMLTKHFIPALTNRDKVWCEPHTVGKLGIEKYLIQLAKRGEPCGPEGTHRLNRGILNSIRDELRLYLAMTIDIWANDPQLNKRAFWDTTDFPKYPKDAAEAEKILVPHAQKILAIYDKYAEQLAKMNAKDRKELGMFYILARGELDEFRRTMLSPDPEPETMKVTKVLIERAEQLIVDTSNYYTIMSALEVEERLERVEKQ